LVAKYKETTRKYNVKVIFEGIDNLSDVTKAVEYGKTVDFTEFKVENYKFKVFDGEKEITDFVVKGDTTLKVVYTGAASPSNPLGCFSSITVSYAIVSSLLCVAFVIRKKKEN